MKKSIPVVIFILVQLASVALLTLWIIWYFISRSQIAELAQKYGVNPSSQTSVLWLLQGIFLIVPVIAGASIIFTYWTKLKALDGLRSNFISSVSHELLTPLASMKLYIETMLYRDIDTDKRKEFLQLMVDDSDRLASLISKLLLASRIERRKSFYHFEDTEIKSFIEKFIATNPLLSKEMEIQAEMEDDLWCKIDRDAFAMTLRNIFENTVRYSGGKKPLVKISLKNENQKLLLRFSDNGEGMEKAHLKKVFSIFYRISKKGKGTGLGLYIVKNQIEAHNGDIWVESEGLGKGSTFNIILPALKTRKRIEND